MRAVYVVAALVVAFLLGAFVEHSYDSPFGLMGRPGQRWGSAPAASPAVSDNTAVPKYSNIRGLEDAPRSDIPQGAKTDFERCVNTMILRREPETEARTVCRKIIAGISG